MSKWRIAGCERVEGYIANGWHSGATDTRSFVDERNAALDTAEKLADLLERAVAGAAWIESSKPTWQLDAEATRLIDSLRVKDERVDKLCSSCGQWATIEKPKRTTREKVVAALKDSTDSYAALTTLADAIDELKGDK
jgi:hypothetical protein